MKKIEKSGQISILDNFIPKIVRNFGIWAFVELIVFEVVVISDKWYVFILAGCCFGWAFVPPGTIGFCLALQVSSLQSGTSVALPYLCFLDLACGRSLLSVHASGMPLVHWTGHMDICLPCILLCAFVNFLWLLLNLLLGYLTIFLDGFIHNILSVVD